MKKLILAAGLTMLGAVGAQAQDYPWTPDKPITIIVPWGAGGATDQVTRVTAGVLEDALGQTVVGLNGEFEFLEVLLPSLRLNFVEIYIFDHHNSVVY